MPELPEVETIVKYLGKKILGCKIQDFWCDAPKLIKSSGGVKAFKRDILGKKIRAIRRRGKNILMELEGGKTILIHQKLTGHMLVGNWKRDTGGWKPLRKGALADPVNRFIHLMFWLNGGLMLALSDLRKFAKVTLIGTANLEKSPDIKNLGPDPIDRDFTFAKFQDVLGGKRGKIKQVLMDQSIIAGIGNIYSDEILWEAKIHPFRDLAKLSKVELKAVYRATRKVLKIAIAKRGDSVSDYRLPSGEKGGYQNVQKAYRREGKPCPRKDGGIIQRKKIGGRSAHFCEICQKLS